jgi:hypothetical protein
MNAQQLWQAQTIEAPRMSPAYVRHVASDFDRRRRLRAVPGYLMCLVTCGVLALLGRQFLHTKPLMVAALACFGLCNLYWIYRLQRHVTAESSPSDAGVLDTLRYQRRQFERQRDWRRGSWRWMSLSVLPGYLLELASMYFENDPVPWNWMGVAVVVLVGSIGLAARLGGLQARASQREIDALDSLAGGQ